jgi:hypothetical protein
MDVRPPPWLLPTTVRLRNSVPRDDSQQPVLRATRPAADAGADRVAHPGAGAGAAASVSGRMSMRQPVSRAASRAFWPSRPIASESW